MKRLALLIFAGLLGGGGLLAQRFGRGRGGGEWIPDDTPVRYARDVATHSYDMPEWTNAAAFAQDVFTFVRVQYTRGRSYSRRSGNCFTDFPDSDLNFSYRLQQLTSLKVDPNPRVLRLTDPELLEFPFIYMVEPGALLFDEAEVAALRRYLENGGFLMADDFWGTRQWENFENQMKRVFPERGFVELPEEHAVFSSVFNLRRPRSALQVPNYWTGENSQYGEPAWEIHEGEECREMHIRGISDDQGRLMIIACHNTDTGDGWEREQEFPYFFREFSEKRAYPLGINIIIYAMTH